MCIDLFSLPHDQYLSRYGLVCIEWLRIFLLYLHITIKTLSKKWSMKIAVCTQVWPRLVSLILVCACVCVWLQLKAAQSRRQDLSDQILQMAVTNCDKEPAFEERKARLREKVLELTDLKNDHNKGYEELSESLSHTQAHPCWFSLSLSLSLSLSESLTSKGDHESMLKELQKCLKETEKQSEVSEHQHTKPHFLDILSSHSFSLSFSPLIITHLVSLISPVSCVCHRNWLTSTFLVHLRLQLMTL